MCKNQNKFENFFAKSLKGGIVKICNEQDILKAEFCPVLVIGALILKLFLCLRHLQFGMGRVDLSSPGRFKNSKTQYYAIAS